MSTTCRASLTEFLFGKPKDPLDPKVFHQISLVAFLAWVGLGADGLSSSAYGPEEAYVALGGHFYLALPLALLTVITVFVISASYSQIIEIFPTGGGSDRARVRRHSRAYFAEPATALSQPYRNVVFISVGTAQFKGHQEIETLRRNTEENLKGLVEFANCPGWYTEYRYDLGVDLIAELEALCAAVAQEIPRTVFFSGDLGFQEENFLTRALHNHTPFTLKLSPISPKSLFGRVLALTP